MFLFQPIQVGSLELKNRIIMPALHHNYSPEGLVNEKLIRYYETRARGGVALIIVGGCSIDLAGGGPLMIGLHDDKYIPGLQQLTGAVKEAGAKIAAQLYQAGRYAHRDFTEEEPVA
ncbi:MAG: NADH:flavin oxidoreductase, partial [Dethiobacteria bacterium]